MPASSAQFLEPFRSRQRTVAFVATLVVAALGLAGCSSLAASVGSKPGLIEAIGAENQYANVISQIGGKYVAVTSVLNNPNTDPHTFEASPSVAKNVGNAELIVQNGLGYDGFMNSIESASPNPKRKVIVAQNVLGLSNDTSNPHLWYDPRTMPAVAKAVARDFAALAPTHRAYFNAKLKTFDASLQPWFHAIATFKSKYAGTPVAVTEPVADYLLRAMGAKILTPFVFQADIMNGVDPAPEDITLENGYLTSHEAKVLCYNEQVVDALTSSLRATATSDNVPVVGVYETMPTPGYDYQTWMMAEVAAIQAAVAHQISTEVL